jgi:hypothetical protein
VEGDLEAANEAQGEGRRCPRHEHGDIVSLTQATIASSLTVPVLGQLPW